jgi:hypothetical protein
MGVMTQKYRVLVSLGPKLTIFSKTVGLHLWILSENLSFFNTRKKSHMGQL